MIERWSEAALTSAGFFWKALWAFVLGYAVSSMIQVFVPKRRLARHMGAPDARSLALSTLFGSISSSCSFAALATARSLLLKGAHFVASVAFMFASTNLVIELGILIVLFLGWPFLAAEIVGGLLLIAVSALLIRLTYPRRWIEAARDKVEEEAEADEEDFDPWKRIRSREGWFRVGHTFVMEWRMVWEDIVIGFTVAGLVAALVPPSFWKTLFLVDVAEQGTPEALIAVQNALVAPFVAAATFIGSMGNIPLATVLNSGGVLFAGIMGFIYSDLMVPPLVAVNARYYGWRVALYIAGVMFVSIVVTALALHFAFGALGWTPESRRTVEDVIRFRVDYTLALNAGFLVVAGLLVLLARRHEAGGHGGGAGITVKRAVAWLAALVVAGGLVAKLVA